MHRFGELSGSRIRFFQHSAGSMVFALVGTCCLLGGIPNLVRSHNQSRAATDANSPVYEIVSVKPAPPNSDPDSGGTEELADGYKATNVTLLTLIRRAFGVDLINQVSGGPAWLRSAAFDIQSKLDGSTADRLKKLGPYQRKLARQLMLQALLADRFQLIVHREHRELPVYILVVGKKGPKLHESKIDEARPNETYDSSLESGRDGGKLIGPRMTTRQLASMLTSAVGRTVLDKTGLKGTFDVTLQWTADQPEVPASKPAENGQKATDDRLVSQTSWPSIFTAIQRQLGLKLDQGKGPVEIIVIDHVERPSAN